MCIKSNLKAYIENETNDLAKISSDKTASSTFLKQNLAKIILQKDPLISFEDVGDGKTKVNISIRKSLSDLVDVNSFKKEINDEKKVTKEEPSINNHQCDKEDQDTTDDEMPLSELAKILEKR